MYILKIEYFFVFKFCILGIMCKLLQIVNEYGDGEMYNIYIFMLIL